MASKGGDYEVGYGKPPRQYQWPKGTSPNPSGRPPKKKHPPGPLRSFDPFLESFLKEMDRPVSIREGDQSVQLPAFEALVRGMTITALKGDYRTAKFLVQQMEAAVSRRLKQMAMMLSDVQEYKAQWRGKVAEARRGLKPVPLPHPDHYNLSPERGVIEYTGPLDHEGAAVWEQLKGILRRREQDLKDARVQAKGNPDSEEAAARIREASKEFRQWLTCVPPGWNWREKVDLRPYLHGGPKPG